MKTKNVIVKTAIVKNVIAMETAQNHVHALVSVVTN